MSKATNQPDKPEVCRFLDTPPEIHHSAFVAPGAEVIGAVTLGKNTSVWFGCVLRADIERIRIGSGTNLQDGTIVHLSNDLGTEVGRFVTCGHRALLHACRIEDEVLVGMGSIIMDGVTVGARCIIGAGSLIPPGVEIPPDSLVLGSPAKVIRTLDREERKTGRRLALKYIQVAREHSARIETS